MSCHDVKPIDYGEQRFIHGSPRLPWRGVLDVRKIVTFCFITPPISLVEGVIKQLKDKDRFISCNINLLNVGQPFDPINCKKTFFI